MQVRNKNAALEDTAVTREYQVKDVEKHLLNKKLEALKQKVARTVFADVREKCVSSIPFYYKHNFYITGFEQYYLMMENGTTTLKLVQQ